MNIKENLDICEEGYLKERFILLREYGGIPITKGNCNDLFENWLKDLIDSEVDNLLKEMKEAEELVDYN